MKSDRDGTFGETASIVKRMAGERNTVAVRRHLKRNTL